MTTQRTVRLSKGVEVLCKDDSGKTPYTCGTSEEAEGKAKAMGPGWTVYKGTTPEFYIARKKGVSKHEKLLTAKLLNGLEVLAIGGGKAKGEARCWGGGTGRANAARNAKALGKEWAVYEYGGAFYLAVASQLEKLSKAIAAKPGAQMHYYKRMFGEKVGSVVRSDKRTIWERWSSKSNSWYSDGFVMDAYSGMSSDDFNYTEISEQEALALISEVK